MASKKICLGMLLIMLIFGMMAVGCEDELYDDLNLPMGPQWTMVSNPPFGTGNIYDMAYGDGKFIAIGDSGSSHSGIAYSTDGENWSLVNNLPQFFYIYYGDTIVYGGGKWVISRGYYSTDGLNWSRATGTPPKIAYGNGKFVAVGGQNEIAHSTDGQVWEAVSNPPFDINDIAYGNGKFIAVGDNKIANSADGINWTTVSPILFDNTLGILCIVYGGGKFVTSDDWDATAYSLDGISWTPITQNKFEEFIFSTSDNFGFYPIAYGNGKWIGLNSTKTSTMGYSSDGINWTPAFNPPDITFPRGALYGNGKFIVFGENGFGNGGGWIAYSIQ